MPSHLHEALLLLFRNRPTLAPDLIRDALHFELPAFTEARIDSADLTDVKPAEYRADLVVLLLYGVPVYGIVIEAQLARDPRKKFVWPVYATSLRARLEVPVSLLVVTADETIARWAAQPIELGNGGVFRPLVLSPSGVPEIVDEVQARADPELAVLSAMAHGRDRDVSKAVRIALAAELAGQGEFARRYFGQGLAEGRAALLQRLLTQRFGPLPAEVTERLSAATIDELDAIGERLLSAATLKEALGPR